MCWRGSSAMLLPCGGRKPCLESEFFEMISLYFFWLITCSINKCTPILNKHGICRFLHYYLISTNKFFSAKEGHNTGQRFTKIFPNAVKSQWQHKLPIKALKLPVPRTAHKIQETYGNYTGTYRKA